MQTLRTTNLLGGANKKDEQNNPENSRKSPWKSVRRVGKNLR